MSNSAEPYANLAAQELLKNGPSLHSWLRKEEYVYKKVQAALKVFEWPMRFAIVHQGCLYLYKDSKDSNFYEVHPLTSYRVCIAQDVGKYPWAFKLIHDKEVKTHLFAVDSEVDLQKWIFAIQAEKEEHSSTGNSHQYNYIDELTGTGQIRRHSPPPIPQYTTRRPHSRTFPGPDTSDEVYLEPDHYDNDNAESAQSTRPRAPPPKSRIQQRSSLPPLPASVNRQPPIGEQASPTLPLHGKPNPGLPAPPGGSSFKTKYPPPLPPRNEPETGCKPRRTSSEMMLATSETMSSVINEMQKGLKASDRQPSMQSRSAARRQRPEGQEEREISWNPLPSSAYFKATDKEGASSLLRSSPIGTYLVRWSVSPKEKALAVRDFDKKGNFSVRHYKIFYSEGRGFALDHTGPHLKSIEELLNHYLANNLPNTSLKLKWPYGKTVSI